MGFSMSDALKREHVQIVESAADWKDAIAVAVQPLVDAGYAEPRYIDGIIENTIAYGPYFVLAPDLALLHARPEQGAIETQLAVTILREGAVFKEGDDPVRVLITLVATDATQHIDVMRQIATMFADPANIERAATSETADDVYAQFVGSES